MAKFKTGDMFNSANYEKFDVVFITTNATLNNKGELIMGAGIARQAMTLFPELPKLFGKKIKYILDKKHNKWYGIAFADVDNSISKHKVAAFQTKVSPYEISNIKLIRFSTECLVEFAMNNPHLNIALNYPGIGLGQLDKSDVEPIVKMLPDNVTIWEL